MPEPICYRQLGRAHSNSKQMNFFVLAENQNTGAIDSRFFGAVTLTAIEGVLRAPTNCVGFFGEAGLLATLPVKAATLMFFWRGKAGCHRRRIAISRPTALGFLGRLALLATLPVKVATLMFFWRGNANCHRRRIARADQLRWVFWGGWLYSRRCPSKWLRSCFFAMPSLRLEKGADTIQCQSRTYA